MVAGNGEEPRVERDGSGAPPREGVEHTHDHLLSRVLGIVRIAERREEVTLKRLHACSAQLGPCARVARSRPDRESCRVVESRELAAIGVGTRVHRSSAKAGIVQRRLARSMRGDVFRRGQRRLFSLLGFCQPRP
jgi:hypothetical protein